MKNESLLCEVPGAILVALVELMVGWLQGWKMYGFIISTVYQCFSKRCEKWGSAITMHACKSVIICCDIMYTCTLNYTNVEDYII